MTWELTLSSSSVDGNGMKEWEQARAVLKDFDERTHDLRKYGFSFVTALLAAQSLLIPSLEPNVTISGTPINEVVKLGVLLVTLLLIVTLRLFERMYELFRQAAAIRAGVLEKTLDLELTDTITSHYRSGHMPELVTLLYVFFVLAVGFIGAFVVPNYIGWLCLAIVVTIASLYAMMLMNLTYGHGLEDWTIDRQECEQGDFVRITLTNLDPKNAVILPKDLPAWTVKSEKGKMKKGKWDPIYNHSEQVQDQITVGPENTHSWIWDTKGVQAGIYQVVPSQSTSVAHRRLRDRLLGRMVWQLEPAKSPSRKDWSYPLTRKIEVRKKTRASEQKPK
jgi:hypothetical protein